MTVFVHTTGIAADGGRGHESQHIPPFTGATLSQRETVPLRQNGRVSGFAILSPEGLCDDCDGPDYALHSLLITDLIGGTE